MKLRETEKELKKVKGKLEVIAALHESGFNVFILIKF